MKKPVKIIGFALSFVSIGLGVYGLYRLKDRDQQDKQNDQLYSSLRERAYSKENDDGEENPINWDELDDNVVAWLKFGDLIDYPVVQGEDNSFFLKHAFDGSYNYNGSIFMSSSNASDFSDMNTLIYGHNMRSGAMFGCLDRWLSKDMKPQEFYLYMRDGTKHVYKVFVAANVMKTDRAYLYSFESYESYLNYQEELKSMAAYDTGIEPDAKKKNGDTLDLFKLGVACRTPGYCCWNGR